MCERGGGGEGRRAVRKRRRPNENVLNTFVRIYTNNMKRVNDDDDDDEPSWVGRLLAWAFMVCECESLGVSALRNLQRQGFLIYLRNNY